MHIILADLHGWKEVLVPIGNPPSQGVLHCVLDVGGGTKNLH